jgi:hypothetical protein
MKEEDRKPKKADDGTIDLHIAKSPTPINIDGSIAGGPLFAGTGYKGTLDITGGAYAGATVLNNDYLSGRISVGPAMSEHAYLQGLNH